MGGSNMNMGGSNMNMGGSNMGGPGMGMGGMGGGNNQMGSQFNNNFKQQIAQKSTILVFSPLTHNLTPSFSVSAEIQEVGSQMDTDIKKTHE